MRAQRPRRLWMLSSFAFAAAMVLGGHAADARAEGACAATSDAAQKACGNEVLDSFWIAIGTCANLGDAAERPGCRADAWKERQDGLQECSDMFDERQKICAALGQEPYDPKIVPSQFVDPDDIGGGTVAANPYLSLKAGKRYEYVNQKAGERDIVDVTYRTIWLEGVRCRVVHDVVTDLETGQMLENTDDFFAQDMQGNVWYFGEISRDYQDGLLTDLEGSWRAGLDDAKPGIAMEAAPQAGDFYRQEFMLGDAEDVALVRGLHGDATSPYASCSNNCLVTRESTPLEPGVTEYKFYKPGLGQILTTDPDTGEREVLVKVTTYPQPPN